MTDGSAAATTEDVLLGGRVRVRQPGRGGYRVNADTVLLALAAGAPASDGARVLDVGCGVGAGLAIVAHLLAGGNARFVGVERDTEAAALARENAAANGLGVAATIIEGDALAAAPSLGVFDRVYFNPPYNAPGGGRAPAAARRLARVEDAPTAAWIAAFSNNLNGGGTMTLIHRADRLGDVLAALEGRLGGVIVAPVHPYADAPARRVIVRARKGSRAPLAIRPGLVLHDRSGEKHTPAAETLLRGDALFDWGEG
ncbi:MAG: methyltransferase domain-containing protein [Alphaproteobacteria bacterium]|nr:methyltransferase domain-containing protein [Alphaproteobacteria bacterium]